MNETKAMNHDELIEGVCRVKFPWWDDLDVMTKKGARRQAEFWLTAAEPLIRADERERYLKAQAETGQIVSTLAYDLSEARITISDLRAKMERAILGEPCAEHGKAACVQTPTCRVEWAQKRLSRDVVHDLMKENIDD